MKFSGIGVFKHSYEDSNRIPQYEERIVYVEAGSIEKAEIMILADFKNYAEGNIEFLGEYEINDIFEEEDAPVIEVTSTTRVFSGSSEEYIDKYWVNKPLSCDDNGWNHVWFNLDGNRSGCYNCQEQRDGKLWNDT